MGIGTWITKENKKDRTIIALSFYLSTGCFRIGAYNGINVYNFWGRRPFIYNNTLDLQADPSNTQKEIDISNNSMPTATYNIINSSMNTNVLARAVYTFNNTNVELGCNSEYTIGRGFEFTGPQNAYWHQNYMQDNKQGFVLGGNIGIQGVPSSIPGLYFGTYNNT